MKDGKFSRSKMAAIGATSVLALSMAFSAANALTLTGGVGLAGGTIVTGIGNECVQIGGVDSTGAGPVTGWSCNNNLNQVWTITNGRIEKINNGTAMCLTANATAGTGVFLESCGTNTGQLWTLTTGGALVNEKSGLCLDWAGAYTTRGATLDVEPCNGSSEQQFWPR